MRGTTLSRKPGISSAGLRIASHQSKHPDNHLLKGLPSVDPHFIPPMQCRLVQELPAGDEWVYEVKFDGYRILAVKDGNHVQLFSRNENDLCSAYPELAEAVRSIPLKQCVIDGELVALDEFGNASFQALQSVGARADRRLVYYAFDILNYKGKDVVRLTLLQRKSLLVDAIRLAPPMIRFSATILSWRDQIISQAKKLHLEGLIAKTVTSKYESGKRTGSWVKFKIMNQQEFVIGGYTRPKGTRKHFGAILIGYYRGDEFIFVCKVGSGFSSKVLDSLYNLMHYLETPECPFKNISSHIKAEGGESNLSPSEIRHCTWIKPRLVAEIRFTEWTGDGALRHPTFLGLREDKSPNEVVKEAPQKDPAS